MKRIGHAIKAPRGEDKREDLYGIYEGNRIQYEGYRYPTSGGMIWVGLPLAGPTAPHNQPYIEFIPEHFAEVTYFGENKK